MAATGTTESTLIGAFACVLMASLLRQVCVPGLSFAWSRQASVIAAVPLAGGLALLLAWRHGIATTTTLSGAMVLGASLLLAVSFTSTVGAIETGDGESGLPDAASVKALVKARRSIFPEHYSGEAVSREALLRAMSAANWAPTHGKTEPWRFVVFQGAKAYSTLLEAKRRATERLMAETPELLASALKKMERKAKQMDKVGALIAICVKRVANVKGKPVAVGRVVSVIARRGGERRAAVSMACLYFLWLLTTRTLACRQADARVGGDGRGGVRRAEHAPRAHRGGAGGLLEQRRRDGRGRVGERAGDARAARHDGRVPGAEG